MVSVAMLPSVKQPYTARPEYLTYNQLTPSVAVIPPSVARLFEAGRKRATTDRLWRTTPPGAEPGEEVPDRTGTRLTTRGR